MHEGPLREIIMGRGFASFTIGPVVRTDISAANLLRTSIRYAQRYIRDKAEARYLAYQVTRRTRHPARAFDQGAGARDN